MRYLFYYTLFFTFNFAQNDFNWQTNGAPIRQGLHIEWQRTGDADADGTMIYAWSDCRNGVRDVIVQKVDADGNKTAVVLDYAVWEQLLTLLEDMGDAEEIRRLREAGEETISWEETKAELHILGTDP